MTRLNNRIGEHREGMPGRRPRNGATADRPPSGRWTRRDLAPGRRVEPVEHGLALSRPPRIRSLVVPLDGSPFGERALPLALEVARRAAAELRIVHVHTRPAPDAPPVRHYFPDGPYGMS